MAEYLLISPPPERGGQASWVVLAEESGAQARTETGPYAQAVTLAGGRRVVLVAAAGHVFTTSVELPTQARQKIQKLLPFALEDQVADEVEELHFALGPQQQDKTWPVAVIARKQMDEWLEDAAAAGLTVDMIVPEIFLLPMSDKGWAAVSEKESIILRTGPYAGFLVDRKNVKTMFSLLLSGYEELPEDQREDQPEEQQEKLPEKLVQYRNENVETIIAPVGVTLEDQLLDDNKLGLYAKNFRTDDVIDLLQGDFSRREMIGQIWRPWRATAALLGMGLLLIIFQNGLQYSELEKEKAMLTKKTVDIYRQAFPNAKRIVNPRAQMQQQLLVLQQGGVAGEGGFLDLLALCGPALRIIGDVQLQGASFRDGRIELDITAKNLQILDKLKQQLSSSGKLLVEIQSATADEKQKVKSRLRVSRVGA